MKKTILFSVILLLVAFGLSWQIGWGATTVKKTSTAIKPASTIKSSLGTGVVWPDYTFYSSPGAYCYSMGSSNGTHPYSPVITDPLQTRGDIYCASSEYICRDVNGGYPEASFPVANTGDQVNINTPHTGNTIFCSVEGLALPVACGKTYSFDLNYPTDYNAQPPISKGNYCENTGRPSSEAEKKCMTYNLRPGKSNYYQTFDDLSNGRVTEITEKKADEWIKNDIWDISGGREQLMYFISYLQSTFGKATGESRIMISYEDILSIKDNYFDKNDIVRGTFNFRENNGNSVGHAIIFLNVSISDAGMGKHAYIFDIIDPNFPGGATPLVCSDSGPFTPVKCSSTRYSDKTLVNLSFLPSETNPLRDTRLSYKNIVCKLPASGDLCDISPRERAMQLANALGGFINWSTAGSIGVCDGWTRTVLKGSYLINFIGEKPTTTSQAICATSVHGEENTSYCGNEPGDYRSACTVMWGTHRIMPTGITPNTVSQFAMCAYKNRLNDVPSDYNLLRTFGVKEFYCNGMFINVEDNPLLTKWGIPISLWYQATAKNSTNTVVSLLDNTLLSRVGNFFSSAYHQAVASSRSFLLSAVSAVYNPPKSCTYTVGNLTLTYQKGYLFSHPSKLANSADYAEIDNNARNDIERTMYHIFSSDVVYIPQADNVIYWPDGLTSATSSLLIDPLSAGYFSPLLDWQKTNGIDTNCRLDKPLPARFKQFLDTVDPLITDGTCGLAHGTSVIEAPSTASSSLLCLAGKTSAIQTVSGYYTWTCGGSGGGTTANCKARKITAGVRSLTFTAPASNSSFQQGNKVNISFTAKGYGLDYTSKPLYLLNASGNKAIYTTAASKTYTIIYPNSSSGKNLPIDLLISLPLGNYKFVICDAVDGNFTNTQWDKTTSGPLINCPVKTESNVFAITAMHTTPITTRSVSFTSPANGLTISSGDTINVSFNTTGYETNTQARPLFLTDAFDDTKIAFRGTSAVYPVYLNKTNSSHNFVLQSSITANVYRWIICDTASGVMTTADFSRLSSGPISACPVKYESNTFTVDSEEPLPPKITTPVAGSCGSAHNAVVADKPTDNLCASGVPTILYDNPAGDGWYWNCTGANGGTTVACKANKNIPVSSRSVTFLAPGSGLSFTNADKVPLKLLSSGYANDKTSKPIYLIDSSGNKASFLSNRYYSSLNLSSQTGNQSSAYPITTTPPGTYRWLICDTADGVFPSSAWDMTTSGPVSNCPVKYESGAFTITAPAVPTPAIPTPSVSYDCPSLALSNAKDFASCQSRGFTHVCFDKNTGVSRGCVNGEQYCTVSNTYAATNISCPIPVGATTVIKWNNWLSNVFFGGN